MKIHKLVILLIALTFGCNDYDTKKYCEFELSKTNYKIRELNNGKYALTYKNYDIVIMDGNNDSVVSVDTCYLKMRAFKFWENEIISE